MQAQITIEFQRTIADKIDAAFNNPKTKGADCFMQKDNFNEIICTSEYFLEDFEKEGYQHFILASYIKEQKDEIKIKSEKKESKKESKQIKASYYSEYYDYPEMYDHCGL